MEWAAAMDELALIRDAAAAGEWWRLWTGHLVHTGVGHLGWNLTALSILGFAAFRTGLVRAAFIYLVLSMPLISGGLLLLLPALQWYAGLSGVLHGLVALILIARPARVAWLGLGLLAAKLVVEAAGAWPVPAGRYPVVTEAHALGFAFGLVAGLSHIYFSRRPRGSLPAKSGAASRTDWAA